MSVYWVGAWKNNPATFSSAWAASFYGGMLEEFVRHGMEAFLLDAILTLWEEPVRQYY